MNRYQPDFVLLYWAAGGRTSLTPERVAINQNDARALITKIITD